MARKITILTVQRTERVAPGMVRVHLGGTGFETFEPSVFTDAYVKLHFGSEAEPVTRTYTVRSVDLEQREIAIDFVVHGDEGVAGAWAESVAAGETVRLSGPGGAYRPDPTADWHLLAGDESALPAIAAAVASMSADAVGQVFVEVAGAQAEVPIVAPAGVSVTWVHRGAAAGEVADDEAGRHAPLVAAVRGAPWLAGEPHVFIHGEAQAVMHGLRPYIRKERGVPAARASISGYWRRGRTEEGFRTWKRDLAAAES
ncbi:siderophore-interacting protein [Tomitella biformata]|uniref:siderophore-interacting protein n=1 Tax=Tomitella biformata TaxID=630403 RepID=UPI0004640E38|nr:siderophore-interacting protein [Tomitella biformata]